MNKTARVLESAQKQIHGTRTLDGFLASIGWKKVNSRIGISAWRETSHMRQIDGFAALENNEFAHDSRLQNTRRQRGQGVHRGASRDTRHRRFRVR